jgi:hypothetical protein
MNVNTRCDDDAKKRWHHCFHVDIRGAGLGLSYALDL